jgi:competence protein ComGC
VIFPALYMTYNRTHSIIKSLTVLLGMLLLIIILCILFTIIVPQIS